MFVKMVKQVPGGTHTTLVQCDSVEWVGDRNEVGAKNSDDLKLVVHPTGDCYLIPPVGTEVFLTNDEGKTIDHI